MARRIPVSLEIAPKRTMASAVDWPGWSRGAKTPEAALEVLAAYGERYGRAVHGVATSVPGATSVADLEIVERAPGGAGTEFGVPNLPLPADEERIGPAELERLIAILEAAWRTLDRAAKRAEGVELTKGPRGGGRELAKIIGHVAEAEGAYIGQLGAKPPTWKAGEPVPMADLRRVAIDTLTARARGEPIANPRNTLHPWLPTYFVRRSAWHTLDHAWEIEDRSGQV